MWPDTRLCDLFGIRHPILQAPMLGTCTPELAAAVTGAGGLGAHACGALDAEAVRTRARAVRALTNGAYNLNFFVIPGTDPLPPLAGDVAAALTQAYREAGAAGPLPPLPNRMHPAPSAEVIEAIIDLAPPVVSFHFGLPGSDAVAQLQAAGCKVISSATTVAEARALAQAGVDAVIAQGWEAGGHRGSHRPTGPEAGVGTLALVPQVVDAVTVPVIAAGGISDGRGIAAAFALGASGVQIGSAFARCPEAATSQAVRQRMARAADSDTAFTDAVSGRSARGVDSSYARAMRPLAGRFPPFPAMYALSDPVSAPPGATEDPYGAWALYGQATALAPALPAGELVEVLASAALATLTGLAGAAQG